MKDFLTAIVVLANLAILTPALAQPQSPYAQPQPSYSNLNSWRLLAPTPEDAYREGLITRLQLEQLTGPLPQALQGPSPDGHSGFGGGGGGGGGGGM